MNSSNLKPARKGERICQSICAYCSRWCRHWFELLASAPAGQYPLYMRWPGERPPPPPGSGPHRDARADDWELAA